MNFILNKKLCPEHKVLLELKGYDFSFCPVPHCGFVREHEGGNPAFHGQAQDYYCKNKKYLYKGRRGV